jgi:hypothetical protein
MNHRLKKLNISKEGILMPKEKLSHPTLGQLPARRILDCIFALAPEGNILHFHQEQVSKSDSPQEGLLYTLTPTPPASGREQCCIIPPFTREF